MLIMVTFLYNHCRKLVNFVDFVFPALEFFFYKTQVLVLQTLFR